MYTLIVRLLAPGAFRISLSVEEKPSEDYFPIKQTWKTMYSIHVLDAMLQDQIKLGLADETFICQSVRILVSLLVRTQTTENLALWLSIADTLVRFLRGKTVPHGNKNFTPNT